MNVKELIEKLKEYPEDMMVVRNGYEDGVEEVSEIEAIIVELNVNTAWYYGKHEEVSLKSFETDKHVKVLKVN